MSDQFEQDQAAQAANEAAEEEAQAQAQEAEEESWSDVDSFIGDDESFELPDPSTVVTIRTSSGGDKYVPVAEPTRMGDILSQSGLYVAGAVQYWLNGAQINADTLVPGGSTVTLIASVKGG